MLNALAVGLLPTAATLNAATADSFKQALLLDARNESYSGVFSLAEAVQGLDRGYFSWATVKLYYGTFYMLRALLGIAGYGLIYVGSKPYIWKAAAGAQPKKENGNTHKVVLEAYEKYCSTSVLLSQPIASKKPLDWLVQRREYANYTEVRFTEPNAPAHFKKVAASNARKLVAAYIEDSTHLYAFDPDHAMLAYPIDTLKLIQSEFPAATSNKLFGDPDGGYLANQCRDKAGPMAALRSLVLS